MKRQKPVSFEKSFDYIKKMEFTRAKQRIPIVKNEYYFVAFISGKSFRNIKKQERIKIKKRLVAALSTIGVEQKDALYHKKLAVRLNLFLPPSYICRVDIDNVAKTVTDCLNKVAYKDDRQIYSLDVVKIEDKKKRGAIGIRIGEFDTIRLRYV